MSPIDGPSSVIDSAWSRFLRDRPLAVLAFALAAQMWPSGVTARPAQPQIPPPPGSPPGVLTTTHWWSTAAGAVRDGEHAPAVGAAIAVGREREVDVTVGERQGAPDVLVELIDRQQ